MADEITITASLQLEKGFLTVDESPQSQSIDMAGTRVNSSVQDIGFAAHELLVTGSDFTTAGWAFFTNLDAANFVRLGLDSGGTFVAFAKLLPGEAFLVPLATKSIYAQADTASVQVKYTMAER